MQPQEITIGTRASLTVAMKTSTSTLGDVVVIGYGTQKRGDINGAVSSISSKQIAEIPQPSVDQMLQGRAAGVTVTRTPDSRERPYPFAYAALPPSAVANPCM